MNNLPIGKKRVIKGLRIKFRNYVKGLGVSVKFSTDIGRDGKLYIFSESELGIDINEYDGYEVKVIIRGR